MLYFDLNAKLHVQLSTTRLLRCVGLPDIPHIIYFNLYDFDYFFRSHFLLLSEGLYK